MQKKLLSLLVLLLTTVLVVGCNTTEKTENSGSEKNDPANTQIEQEPTKETTDENEASTDESTKEEPATESQQEVTYVQKGVDKTEETTLVGSEAQNFQLQQLPAFTLTQEEPGKDLLVSKENDEVFMRIETFDASQTNFDTIKTSMQDYMNAVGSTIDLPAEELSMFKDVKNIVGTVVDFDTEKVVSVVFEKDQLITKLTIHDNSELDLTNAMLTMATTISKK
ncbi:hypothetical protein [Lysinibacillus piscis]|uniref:Lipoprotein n=1 Tax=Lysinibacillus piscis TaxID=2518931 RepID=A0ABQ5NH26_9BACI|nr:hypothetical protein [Lysinibacillus sp. KH24]GLC87673.1 hypothetical protein LYSBPC_08000 [Lysinibacillus sp. KH24]